MKAIVIGLGGVLLSIFVGSSFAREVAKDSCDPSRSDSPPKTGLFIVHQRCGRVLYEIPTLVLNRVMLINTEFAALQERQHDSQTSGRFADTRLVRWVRNGDQVRLSSSSSRSEPRSNRDKRAASRRSLPAPRSGLSRS